MEPATSQRQGGAAIAGKTYWSNNQGPGTCIMAADTLEGNEMMWVRLNTSCWTCRAAVSLMP